MAEISARQLLDLKQWQKIQDLFAEIVGANLWLLEPQGSSLTNPSQISCSCSDLNSYQKLRKTAQVDCVFKAFQHWVQTKEITFSCPHRLSYLISPIRYNETTVGAILVGPVLVGKRERESAYHAVCERESIHFDLFLDRIREIKVFSHNGIRVVIDFLQELTQHLLKLSYHRAELERLVPGFLETQKSGDGFFSATYVNLLVNYLLDIASEVVHADSGSVLLLDENRKSFSIKLAKGIRPEILRKRLPLNEGVAGWVASQKRAVLIGSETSDKIPKARLKRPQIKSSMVVPLEFDQKMLGVFCLNAKSANKRFNRNNLQLLGQLGKLASVALARVGAN
ncbi:MAG: PocR ligand-binding domain-containing protein [Candidatus Omnitrophica bacterium]|nr:PocR ligand-binding domain-containing protein [Candidatus Omnitrophota bacterium]